MTTETRLPEKIRRSWRMVPAPDEARAIPAPKTNTDAVLLDLGEFVAEKDQPSARESLAETVRRWLLGHRQ